MMGFGVERSAAPAGPARRAGWWAGYALVIAALVTLLPGADGEGRLSAGDSGGKASGTHPGARAAVQHPAPSSEAELRFAFERLLSDHATLVNRLMRSAVRGDESLVQAANQAIVSNTNELVDLVASVHGQDAADEFEKLWAEHVFLLFDYARTAGEPESNRQPAAAALDGYRSRYGAFVEKATAGRIPAATAADGVKTHLDQLTQQLDAYVQGDFARAYRLQRESFAHMFPMGRELAGGLAHHPGELVVATDDRSAQLRSTLGLLLGEHFTLMVDTMRAASTGASEFQAAASAVDANKAELTRAMDSLFGAATAAEFNSLWASHVDLLIRYTTAVVERQDQDRDRVRAEVGAVRGRLGQAFSSMVGGRLSPADATATLAAHDEQLYAQIDAYAARDYPRAYDVSYEGYRHMLQIAAALAPAIEAELASRMPVGGAQTGGGGIASRHPRGND